MSTTSTITSGLRRWKRYPECRATGISWLGEIPSHWQVKRLKFVASGVEIKSLKPADKPYIGLENIESSTGKLLLDAPIDAVDSSVSHFQADDVLFGKLRPYLAKVVLAPFAGVCSTEVLVLRPILGIHPSFLAAALLSDGFIRQVDSLTYGVKMPRANPQQVMNQPVCVPPLNEQRRIVEFLDRETAKIDALIAKKERLIELLQEKRTSLVSHAVIRGIESAVPMKDSGLEWVRQIPAHWTVLRNGFLFLDRDQRGYPDLPILEVSIHTGVKVREFSGEHVEQKAEDHSTYKRSLAGDLAFNKMRMWQGAVGVTPVDGLVSPDYQVCRPRPGVHSRYFEQLFRTSFYLTEINRYSHGIVKDRNRLYWDQFKEMPSLVPPPEEQLKIIEHVDAITKRTGAMIAKVQEAIDKLREYRTALISAAVTGKIDVASEAVAVAEPTPGPVTPAAKPANAFFRRSVFAAEIIDRLCDEPTFGHVKFQKCLFVAQHHLRIGDFEESYKRMAAGPYDNRLVRSVDSQLEKGRWFKAERTGDRYAYRRLDKAGGHRQYFERYFGEQAEPLARLLDLFRPMTTDQAEIVATLYAVWNDFLLRGEPCDDDRIVAEVLTNWHDRKKRFEDDRWRRALGWMRENGLVPTGFGTPTVPGDGGNA